MKKSARSTPAATQNTLFAAVTAEAPDLSAIVKTWYQEYKQHPDTALEDLLDFVLQSCGLQEKAITAEDLNKEVAKETLSKLEVLAQQIQTYPLMSGGHKGLKNFFEDFQYFWVHLIGEGREDIYDGKLLNFLIDWMCSLSLSKFRPIRHTSTAALFAMGQTLTNLLTVELKNLGRVQTFLESEEAGARVTRLRAQEEETKQHILTLRETVDILLNEVLTDRCKDVMGEIRSLCSQYLGTLMTKCPQLYITDQTISILSLMLYDKNSDVREHVLDYLNEFYAGDEETYQKLRKFTDKQRLRLVEMCHDIEPRCCVRALRICSKLAARGELLPDERDLLSCLMWEETEEVRKAAGDFVASWLFKPLPLKDGGAAHLDQGRRIDAEKSVSSIVRFFREYGDSLLFRVKLMVQAFWERPEMIKQWEVYCDMLQRGQRGNTTELDVGDGLVVLTILKATLEILSESDKALSKTRFADLSALLFERLVHIFPLCQHSPELLQALCDLVPALDLSPIASKDIRGSVLGLVEHLRLVFLRSADPKLLNAIGRGFDRLCSNPHPLQKEAMEGLMKTDDEVVEELVAALQSAATKADPEESVLGTWLARAASLLAVQDLVDELRPAFEPMCALLEQFRNEQFQSPNISISALRALFYFHLWLLSRIASASVTLEQYLQCRNTVIDELTTMMQSQVAGEVKDEAFKLLCETLMISAGQAAEGQPIYFEVSYQMHRAICEFMDNIEIKPVVPEHMRPAKAFQKLSIKIEPAEDADCRSLDLLTLLARVICNCPSLTHSNVPSGFLAAFGNSPLKSVSNLVKQVMSYLRSRDALQAGAFRDRKLYFDILMGALLKCFSSRPREAKELSKRLASLQGVGQFKPHQAVGLRDMVVEGVTFALSGVENIPFLEAMSAFLTKGFLPPTVLSEIWDRLVKDLHSAREKVETTCPARIDMLQDLSNFQALLMKLAGQRPENPTIGASEKRAGKTRKSSARRSVKSEVHAAESQPKRESSAVAVKLEESRSPVRHLDFIPQQNGGKRAAKQRVETNKVLQADPLELTGSGVVTAEQVKSDDSDVTPGKRKQRSSVHDPEGEIEEPVGRSRKSAQRRRKAKR